MLQTNTIWFEIAIVTIVILFGHIYFGHFEERSPKWRKVLKYLVTVLVIVSISLVAGRTYALIFFGLLFIPVIYIHAVLLPKKGINGWTGEPKSRYYDFRGWSKDIFSDKKQVP